MRGYPINFFWLGGTAGDDIFVVGQNASGYGVIWHYDGATWAPETIPEVPGLGDIAATTIAPSGKTSSNTTAAITVGDDGTILTVNLTTQSQPPGLDRTVSNFLQSLLDKEPISTFTGEYILVEDADLALGGPMPLGFGRYYASGSLGQHSHPHHHLRSRRRDFLGTDRGLVSARELRLGWRIAFGTFWNREYIGGLPVQRY